jgi:hypothetical protein
MTAKKVFKYSEDIDFAIKNNIIKESESIFDYRDTPLEKLCDNYYQFSKNLIETNIERFKIKPTAVIFLSNYSSNAKAVRKNDTFSIQINIGLIKNCEDKYLKNKKLDDYFLRKIPNIQELVPISLLAYQVSTYFTLYHELAHLIQFEKRKSDSTLQERYEKDSAYDDIKHHLEINADTFASDCITRHIIQYFEQIFNKKNSTDEEILSVLNLILIICTCLLNHIASFTDELPNIYYKKFKHPHPFVRLFIVLINFISNIKDSFFIIKKRINLDTDSLFDKMINLYIALEKENIFSTEFKDTLEIISKERVNMSIYMIEIIDFDKIKEFNNALEISK